MKTFILHDESVNSYGFRMLTDGVILDDFKKNPVMFYNHDDREMPIGRWEKIRIEDGKILAEANFDQGDPRAKEIARKVEEGGLLGWVEAHPIATPWGEEPGGELAVEGVDPLGFATCIGALRATLGIEGEGKLGESTYRQHLILL